MSIIVCAVDVVAQMSIERGALAIRFEDPAYIRAEQVLIDPMSGEVTVLFEQGCHGVGRLPTGADPASLQLAYLSGDSHDLRLCAPVKLLN